MITDKAKQYSKEKYTLFFLDIIFTFTFLVCYQYFFSEKISKIAYSLSSSFFMPVTFYCAIFSAAYYFFSFPLSLYSSFILEHKFSLSTQNFSSWLKDDLKKSILSLFVFLILINGFYLFLKKTDTFWWIWTALGWVFFNIIFAKILPNFIIPLFYKYSELSDSELKNDIKKLAGRAGIRLIGVSQIDFSKKTKKANAACVGLGSSRRVILTDTLIKNFSRNEINTVCAHEFAHHKLLHIWKLLGFFGITSAVGFYTLSALMGNIVKIYSANAIYDLKIFPILFLLLFVFSLFMKPAANYYSRKLEQDADRFAIELTEDKNSFITLMKKLSEMNLSDDNPPKIIKYIFFDHPPIKERIESAKTQ